MGAIVSYEWWCDCPLGADGRHDSSYRSRPYINKVKIDSEATYKTPYAQLAPSYSETVVASASSLVPYMKIFEPGAEVGLSEEHAKEI